VAVLAPIDPAVKVVAPLIVPHITIKLAAEVVNDGLVAVVTLTGVLPVCVSKVAAEPLW
jgi:hypothetical protein